MNVLQCCRHVKQYHGDREAPVCLTAGRKRRNDQLFYRTCTKCHKKFSTRQSFSYHKRAKHEELKRSNVLMHEFADVTGMLTSLSTHYTEYTTHCACLCLVYEEGISMYRTRF